MPQTLSAIYSHGDQTMMDYTPNVDVAAGAIVAFGSGLERLIGIALSPLSAGVLGSLEIEAIYKLKKKSGTVIAQGAPVGWDTALTQAVADGDGSLDFQAGVCVGDGGAAANDDYVLTRINMARGWAASQP